MGKKDLKKYGAVVREKIDKYKKMREELASLRSELVILQRTEQILKSRHENLDQFLEELERQKGVQVIVIYSKMTLYYFLFLLGIQGYSKVFNRNG
jgi:uncharacterized protein YjgD (DUF1641 family)